MFDNDEKLDNKCTAEAWGLASAGKPDREKLGIFSH